MSRDQEWQAIRAKYNSEERTLHESFKLQQPRQNSQDFHPRAEKKVDNSQELFPGISVNDRVRRQERER